MGHGVWKAKRESNSRASGRLRKGVVGVFCSVTKT